MPPTDFSEKVIKYIKAIPKGKVATYGQIAALAGKPQGARGVSWLLHSSTKAHKLPWHRVIGSTGTISIPKSSSGYHRQKKLLQSEGIVFEDGQIDLKKYRWNKKPKTEKRSPGKPRMFG